MFCENKNKLIVMLLVLKEGQRWTYRECNGVAYHTAQTRSTKMASFFTEIRKDCWNIYLLNKFLLHSSKELSKIMSIRNKKMLNLYSFTSSLNFYA